MDRPEQLRRERCSRLAEHCRTVLDSGLAGLVEEGPRPFDCRFVNYLVKLFEGRNLHRQRDSWRS